MTWVGFLVTPAILIPKFQESEYQETQGQVAFSEYLPWKPTEISVDADGKLIPRIHRLNSVSSLFIKAVKLKDENANLLADNPYF